MGAVIPRPEFCPNHRETKLIGANAYGYMFAAELISTPMVVPRWGGCSYRDQRPMASGSPTISGRNANTCRRSAPNCPMSIYVEDLTQVRYVRRVTFPIYRPRTDIHSGYQGTLGFGFATALGAKVGRPDLPAVSVSGDGGFMRPGALDRGQARHRHRRNRPGGSLVIEVTWTRCAGPAFL